MIGSWAAGGRRLWWWRTVHWSLATILLLGGYPQVWACQVEYSDWLIDALRSQGVHMEKRVGNFATQEECEAARQDAIQRSGDPGLANNMRCVDCPATAAQSVPTPATPSAGVYGAANAGPSAADRDAAAQALFESGRQGLLQSLKGTGSGSSGLGLKAPAAAGSGLALKTGTPPPAPAAALSADASELVRKEQDDFDRMRAEWLRRQQELTRQSVAYDNQWRHEVLASIKAIRVPNPAARPKELDDLRPGDVLLIGPDESFVAGAIKRADPMYRALDSLVSNNVTSEDLRYGKASHVLTFVRKVKEELLFLDHTSEGSRILNEQELMRRYGNRLAYIAKPQTKVDGRRLWEVARKAALQKKSDYGLLGSSVVCSERAAIAVAKATGVAMDKERHLFGLGAIDITPADFFDDKHVGKYFLVSTRPIVLRGK